jgi:hypothetical protein
VPEPAKPVKPVPSELTTSGDIEIDEIEVDELASEEDEAVYERLNAQAQAVKSQLEYYFKDSAAPPSVARVARSWITENDSIKKHIDDASRLGVPEWTIHLRSHQLATSLFGRQYVFDILQYVSALPTVSSLGARDKQLVFEQLFSRVSFVAKNSVFHFDFHGALYSDAKRQILRALIHGKGVEEVDMEEDFRMFMSKAVPVPGEEAAAAMNPVQRKVFVRSLMGSILDLFEQKEDKLA